MVSAGTGEIACKQAPAKSLCSAHRESSSEFNPAPKEQLIRVRTYRNRAELAAAVAGFVDTCDRE